MPLKMKITPALKADLERLAKEDGVQRGVHVDSAGNMLDGKVSVGARGTWLFKTTNGKPFEWGKENAP